MYILIDAKIFFGVSDGELALNSIAAVAEGTVFDICVTLTSSGSHLGFDVNVTINTLDGKAGNDFKYMLFTTFSSLNRCLQSWS